MMCLFPNSLALTGRVAWVVSLGSVVAFLTSAPASADETASTTRRQILERLAAPAPQVEFDATPLAEFVEKLRRELAIPVLLDRRALEEVGVPTDTAITLTVDFPVTTRSMLQLSLREHDLKCVVTHEVLLITTPEEAATRAFASAYDVLDLVRVYAWQEGDGRRAMSINRELKVNFESLIELFTTTLAADTWDEVGGLGSIKELPPGQLIVRQTGNVHRDIELALAALRSVPIASEQNLDEPLAAVPLDESASQQHIRLVLDNEADISWIDTPLEDAMRSLARQFEIPILIDRMALEEMAIPINERITLEVSGISLRSALELMLRGDGLTAIVTDDVLLVTTREQSETELKWRLYPVGDLVSHRGTTGRGPDFDSLIESLTASVGPETWDEVGGAGSLETFPQRAALAIHQTPWVHREIAQLLTEIRTQRRSRESPVEVEQDPQEVLVRAYQVSDQSRDAATMIVNRAVGGTFGNDVGAFYYVTHVGDQIIVRHRRDKHQEIEQLLRELAVPQARPQTGPFSGSGGGFFRHR